MCIARINVLLQTLHAAVKSMKSGERTEKDERERRTPTHEHTAQAAYRHGDFRQLLANAVLHDAPQVEGIVWLVRDAGPSGSAQLAWGLQTQTHTHTHTHTHTDGHILLVMSFVYVVCEWLRSCKTDC